MTNTHTAFWGGFLRGWRVGSVSVAPRCGGLSCPPLLPSSPHTEEGIRWGGDEPGWAPGLEGCIAEPEGVSSAGRFMPLYPHPYAPKPHIPHPSVSLRPEEERESTSGANLQDGGERVCVRNQQPGYPQPRLLRPGPAQAQVGLWVGSGSMTVRMFLSHRI